MGAVSKPVQNVVQKAFEVTGVKKAEQAASSTPAAQAAALVPQAAKAALVPAAAVQQAREQIGGQMKRRGRAANILAGESAGNAAVQAKRLLGE